MLKKIYLSPIGWLIIPILNLFSLFQRPFMAYGYYNRVKNRLQKFTRISSSAVLLDKKNLDLGDNTWVGHYSIIDSSYGVKIGEGCQLAAWIGVYSHSSHIAIRLLGRDYMRTDIHYRSGYQSGPVEIGPYSFIGAQTIILPGVKIGKGCLIGAHSLISKSLPDFAVVAGNPAQVIGDTRQMDRKYLADPSIQMTYFDRQVVEKYLSEQAAASNEEPTVEARQ